MSEKIIHYDVCSANDHIQLTELINQGINQGFQPYGFSYTTIQNNILFIHQPMVQYAKKQYKKVTKIN